MRRGDLGPSDDPQPLDRIQWRQSWCRVLRAVIHIGAARVEHLRQLHLGRERSERHVPSSMLRSIKSREDLLIKR
jgi:hypothetical protein